MKLILDLHLVLVTVADLGCAAPLAAGGGLGGQCGGGSHRLELTGGGAGQCGGGGIPVQAQGGGQCGGNS